MTTHYRHLRTSVAVFSVLAVAMTTGCVTVNTQTAGEMSNGVLCEMLGPKWVTTRAERDTIYKEIEARGVTCVDGTVVNPTSTPSHAQPSRPEPQVYEPAPTVPSAADACATMDGASLIADDDTYLGEITNKYGSDSIYNEYGSHGSPYASDSIWNQYSTYGSEYSSSSPWNAYSSGGPLIVKNGYVLGRLTVNEYVDGAVNPTILGAVCFDSNRGNPN